MAKTNPVCQRCHGLGRVTVQLRQSRSTPYKFAQNDSCLVSHIVSCDMCDNGYITSDSRERYLRSIGGPAYDRFMANKQAAAV